MNSVDAALRILNFGSFPRLVIRGRRLSHYTGWQLPVSHVIMSIKKLFSKVYWAARFFVCLFVLWILNFVFLHLIMSTKSPPMSSASGEKKKRKMIALEIKLKIIVQLQANISVLSMCKVSQAKL